MDAALIRNWNDTVGPEDTVWHLGDFAVRHPAPGPLLGQLHGDKHLITGNNDPPGVTSLPGWASVSPYREVEVEGRALVLCHYPFRSWRNMGRGALNLHGHSHGRLRPQTRQFDIGVDARDFRPVSLSQLSSSRRHA